MIAQRHNSAFTAPGLPPEQWPPAERAILMERHAAPDDPFAEVPASATWSTAYRRTVAMSYRRWLGFIAAFDPALLSRRADERLTPNTLSAYLKFLDGAGVALVSQCLYVTSLSAAIAVLAPACDRRWIGEVSRRLYKISTPVRAKHERIVAVERLYTLGIGMMERAREEPSVDAHRFLLHRDGLLIAMWAARPLRISNMADLEIGRSLIIQGDEGVLVFDQRQMKARVARKWAVPSDLMPYLHRYLLERAALPHAGTHASLWVTSRGAPLRAPGLAHALARRTEGGLGTRLHPHAIRHSAGTSIALQTPINAKIAMSVLGHTNLQTASSYYNAARIVDAQRKTRQNLQVIKKALKQKHRGTNERRISGDGDD